MAQDSTGYIYPQDVTWNNNYLTHQDGGLDTAEARLQPLQAIVDNIQHLYTRGFKGVYRSGYMGTYGAQALSQSGSGSWFNIATLSCSLGVLPIGTVIICDCDVIASSGDSAAGLRLLMDQNGSLTSDPYAYLNVNFPSSATRLHFSACWTTTANVNTTVTLQGLSGTPPLIVYNPSCTRVQVFRPNT